MMLPLILAAALAQASPAPAPHPTPTPTTPPAAGDAPSAAELKATIVRLQAQVLERDLEIGKLRQRAAELELAALQRAVAGLEPEVRKLLGLDTPIPTGAPPSSSPAPTSGPASSTPTPPEKRP